MIDPIVKDLNLERYTRLLRRASGTECPVAFCDATGRPVWSHDGGGESRISAAIRDLNDQECVFTSGPVQRIDFDVSHLGHRFGGGLVVSPRIADHTALGSFGHRRRLAPHDRRTGLLQPLCDLLQVRDILFHRDLLMTRWFHTAAALSAIAGLGAGTLGRLAPL